MSNGAATGLPQTGERLLTGTMTDTALEHLHRYALAVQLCRGKHVLDIASGEGYGSNLLADVAAHVTGVDVADDAVRHAAGTYRRDNLVFRSGSADRIPLDDAAVDVVVSFETIEHHAQHEEMLVEIRRVLRPGGLLVMSSPDKRYYADVPHYHNPYHVKELYLDEFRSLVRSHFAHVQILRQRLSFGSLLVPESGSEGFMVFHGDYRTIESSAVLPEAVYAVCVASDASLPPVSPSFYDGASMLRMRIDAERANSQRTSAELDAARLAMDGLERSWSFRLGRMLTWPGRVALRPRQEETN